MSAERGWIIEPRPNPNSVEIWAERHRLEGHHPHPAPTPENPERWECDCGGVNRILTGEQIRMKFRHLGAAAEARRKGIPLPWDDPAWRGLDVTRPMLVGIDGSKALRKAVLDVLDRLAGLEEAGQTASQRLDTRRALF